MWNLNYDSPKEIERVLNEKGLAMSKKFGQNFLISPEGRKRLVDLMELETRTREVFDELLETMDR